VKGPEQQQLNGSSTKCDYEYSNKDSAFLNEDNLCSIQEKQGIPGSWILLDSHFTVYLLSSPRLLAKIDGIKQIINLKCNAGKAVVTKNGNVKGCRTLWYYPQGIANKLSLYNRRKNTR